MPDIFDEVLADKKRLLEVAEKNATNKLIAAVTPRIRELIENELLGEDGVRSDGEDDDDLLLQVADGPGGMGGMDGEGPMGHQSPDPMPHHGMGVAGAEMNPVLPADAGAPDLTATPPAAATAVTSGPENAAISLPDAEGKVTLDMDALHADGRPVEDEGSFELNAESVKALRSLLGEKATSDPDHIELRVYKMKESLSSVSGKKNVVSHETARQVKVECESLYRDLQDTRSTLAENDVSRLEQLLEGVYSSVMKEFNAKSFLSSVVLELKRINKRASELGRIDETSTHGTAVEPKAAASHVVSCFKMMQELVALHTSIRGLRETLGANDNVNGTAVRQVEAEMATMYKEMRQMASKKGKLMNEGEIMLRLSLPDELDVTPEDLDVSVVGDEEGGEEMGEPGEAGGEEMDLDLDVGGAGEEEPHDEELESYNMGESDGMNEEEEEMDEADGMNEEEEEEVSESAFHDDDIVEIDEAALRSEMARMMKLREAAMGPTKGKKATPNKNQSVAGGHGPAHFDAFGGGKDEGEPFLDRDNDDLNVLGEAGEDDGEGIQESEVEEDYGVSGDKWSKKQDRKERAPKSGKNEGAKKAARNENKQLQQATLEETKQALEEARAELAESKLFNTKLEALNKLLQVKGLTKTQKLKIVESLERGRSEAEVKQLYSKIVSALKKSSPVNESADKSLLGSSSRAINSGASSATESDPLLERWARIAGTDKIQG